MLSFLNPKGRDKLNVQAYEKLARYFGVTVDELLGVADETRGKIIGAAERLFAESGFDGVTVKMICHAADVKASVFAAQFEDKNDLLYEIISQYNDRSFDDARKIRPLSTSLLDRLCHIFHLYYVNDISHLGLTAAMHAYSWDWDRDRERDNQRHLSDHHQMIIDVLQEAARRKQIKNGDFLNASNLMFAAYTMVFRRAVYQDLTTEELMATLEPQIRLILDALDPKA